MNNRINKWIPLGLFLLFLSLISGYLLSKASLAGRIGISLFYKEYRFLKTWWQGAATVFIVLFILMLLQIFLTYKLRPQVSRLIHLGMILLALLGAYLTYQDFHTSLSHRLLGGRFHLGAYLFWLGWIVISAACLLHKRQLALPA